MNRGREKNIRSLSVIPEIFSAIQTVWTWSDSFGKKVIAFVEIDWEAANSNFFVIGRAEVVISSKKVPVLESIIEFTVEPFAGTYTARNEFGNDSYQGRLGKLLHEEKIKPKIKKLKNRVKNAFIKDNDQKIKSASI